MYVGQSLYIYILSLIQSLGFFLYQYDTVLLNLVKIGKTKSSRSMKLSACETLRSGQPLHRHSIFISRTHCYATLVLVCLTVALPKGREQFSRAMESSVKGQTSVLASHSVFFASLSFDLLSQYLNSATGSMSL